MKRWIQNLLGACDYRDGNYVDAENRFWTLLRKFPGSEKREAALYMVGLCHLKQSACAGFFEDHETNPLHDTDEHRKNHEYQFRRDHHWRQARHFFILVKAAYPKYVFPRGTYGWEPSTRTVNGGPGWILPPPAPKPKPVWVRAYLWIEKRLQPMVFVLLDWKAYWSTLFQSLFLTALVWGIFLGIGWKVKKAGFQLNSEIKAISDYSFSSRWLGNSVWNQVTSPRAVRGLFKVMAFGYVVFLVWILSLT
jgi:hypothetical protein